MADQDHGPSRQLTHRRVLAVAVPVVISNATVPILGAVDTGVVGQMGLAAPIGAVGIGAIILSAIYWIFGFLRMGTAGLAAQALGRDDAAEVAALLTRVLMIGTGAGVFFIVMQVPIFWAAFQVSPATAEVEGLATVYLETRIWSAPAAIAIFGLTGWLVAHERTGAVLAIQLWMNGLNIALDLLFVLHFDWGVRGVALATVIAEWTGLMLGVWMVRGAFSTTHWRNWAVVFDQQVWRRMMALNADILIRSLFLQAGFIGFMFVAAGLGDVTLAANQVLMQFVMFIAYALDGFAFAVEALVGQALGARNRNALRRSVVICGQWTVGTMVMLSVVFLAGGQMVINLMTTSADVRATAAEFLPWILVTPLISGPSFLLDGIFIGATRGRDMRNMMALSFAIYVAAAAVLLPAFENHGLWAAMMVFFVARAATLAARYPVLEAEADSP